MGEAFLFSKKENLGKRKKGKLPNRSPQTGTETRARALRGAICTTRIFIVVVQTPSRRETSAMRESVTEVIRVPAERRAFRERKKLAE